MDTENVSRWWEGLSNVDQAGGLFGTKIIFQFYSRFIRALDGKAGALPRRILGDKVIRTRRDIAAVAVSDYIAHAVKIWHIWSAQQRMEYDRAVAALSIDDEALLQRYLAFQNAEAAIDALISKFDGEVLEVDFDELTQSTDRVINGIAAFLGRPIRPTRNRRRDPREWITQSPQHKDAYQRLRRIIGKSGPPR